MVKIFFLKKKIVLIIKDDIKNTQNNPQILKAMVEGTNLKKFILETEEELLEVEKGTIMDCIL